MDTSNLGQYSRGSAARQPVSCLSYTYHLPYAARKEVCNILDANQAWKTLGGLYMGLDGTQLTLIGQALMRKESPTEELLSKLDSANVRIVDLSYYLRQMNQFRAVEILKPFVIAGEINISNEQSMLNDCTLHTPTPSFSDSKPCAIMGPIESSDSLMRISSMEQQYEFELQEQSQQVTVREDTKRNETDMIPPPTKCHRSSNQPPPISSTPAVHQAAEVKKLDPGEEIVRMACAINRKRTSISDQEVVNQLRLIMQITYSELKQASNDFSSSNIIGNGGFASVYRGYWKGTEVAIKRLKCNLMDQALNELSILNSYKIDNILPIYGISIDGPEACLIYQFMANGSLEDRLSCKKNTEPLSWQQRALIGEGVAKGLYYLHTVRDKPLVHGDVKSANVLLDAQFMPKLGDFGLARQVFKDKNPDSKLLTHCTVSSIHGTSVYLPIEYLKYKILSPAVDVYSYGIVLLEMATGRRAYDGKRRLIDLVEEETQCMSMGQIGYNLKDSRLVDDSETDLKIWFELLIKLGISCAHVDKRKRLDMGQVLDRFVSFRANSTEEKVASNNNSAISATTSPDTNQPEASHNQQVNHHNDDTRTGQKTLNLNINSALMSVEEEKEVNDLTSPNNHPKPENGGNRADDGHKSSVEAVIPLLTELGLEQDVLM